MTGAGRCVGPRQSGKQWDGSENGAGAAIILALSVCFLSVKTAAEWLSKVQHRLISWLRLPSAERRGAIHTAVVRAYASLSCNHAGEFQYVPPDSRQNRDTQDFVNVTPSGAVAMGTNSSIAAAR
jgi:hypothetical protein